MPEYRSYGQDVLNEAVNYVNNYDVIYGDRVPSRAGLCRALSIGKQSLYRWGELHEAFRMVLEQLALEKERKLINNGLIGTFNSNITKLMLAEDGYMDRSSIDINPSSLKELSNEELNYVIKHGRLPDTA